MRNKILLRQFEFQIVQNSNGIQIEKRPFSLVFLGFGIGLIATVVFFLSSMASTEVLQILLHGFSYLIGILSAVFILIGLVSFIQRFKVQLKIDLKQQKIFTSRKAISFYDVESIQIVPLGISFLTLQFSLKTKDGSLRILTLPVSKIELLENLKKDFEQIFAVKPTLGGPNEELSKNSKLTEGIQHQGDQVRKLTFIFTVLLGFLCAVIFYFIFPGLEIRSRYSDGTQIPFWSIGVAIMMIGVFNFFKNKK